MNIHPADEKNISQAGSLIQKGQLVAFPTETVYGVGADATSETAVARIFVAKGRPQFNPLIVHVASVAMARELVKWNQMADTLAKTFWPGPLTCVLPRKNNSPVALLASAGGDSLGIRMPDHSVALALLNAARKPIAAPSANRSGRVSPTTALHVSEELQDSVAMILDGGSCNVGIESTVLDLCGKQPVLLRPGGITKEQLEQVLGMQITAWQEQQAVLKSPGLLESHYAPTLQVRLNITDVRAGEALLAFGPKVPPGAAITLNLSEQGDCIEAASRLFAALRMLDKPEFSGIAVMPVPMEGIGLAINDRLQRAAAPRR